MTSRETETHCMGTYSGNTDSFKNSVIVLNELIKIVLPKILYFKNLTVNQRQLMIGGSLRTDL